MIKYPLLLSFLLLFHSTHAQICNYLLYDGFNYSGNQSIQGTSGGVGWNAPWDIQNGSVALPGYQTQSGNLSYLDLQGNTGHVSGGQNYLTAGRVLNTSPSGPFSSFLQNNGLGLGHLYMSYVLNKTNNNNHPVFVSLHNSNIGWCDGCSSSKISCGYFGSASDSAGQRWWSVNINDTIYRTPVAVMPSTNTFFVVEIQFGNPNTIRVFINPTSLGNNLPATPNFLHANSSSYDLRSVAVYLGDVAGQGSVDEIRMADSYTCVAPDANTIVNSPPIASFVVSTTSGMVPFTTSFDGTSSSDPGGTIIDYEWNFGDGTAPAHGALVNHTFQTTGLLTVSLRVTDNNNISHTAYQNITCLNSNGTFKCPLSLQLASMATCNQNNGSIILQNTGGLSFQLRNQSNVSMPLSGNGYQYENLATGDYSLYVAGVNGCSDTFHIQVPTDSATCLGWQPNLCDLQLGMGLEGLSYYAHGRAFKDFFKSVGEWVTFPIGGNVWSTNQFQDIPKDSNGYPLYIPFNGNMGVRGVISALGFLPDGENMRLLYDGEGTLVMQGGVTNVVSVPGQIDFTVLGDGNIWFDMLYSNSANPVRNIRLVLWSDLNTYQTQPFREAMLEKLRLFKCLRFMDWMQTNNNDNIEWVNRTKPTYYSQSITPNGGVAYEYIIALANTYTKDIWINIPHQASDDYIMQMATLFKNGLKPGIQVYVEYSNEVWNWQFEQAHFVADSTNQSIPYPRRYVERASHAYRIWNSVWGSESHRVTRILGLQLTNNYLNREILAHADPNDYEAVSPSFYVGLDYSNNGVPDLSSLGAAATPQQIVANANHVFETVYPLWQDVYRDARMFKKPVVNYEGGQHFTNFSIPPFLNAMYAAQYIPEMYTLYSRMIDSLRVLGSSLAVAFTFTGPNNSIFGSWGHIPNFELPPPYTAYPKFQALLDQVNEKPNPAIIGAATVSAGQLRGYKVALPQPSQTYIWQTQYANIINGQGSDSITVQFVGMPTDTLRVTVSGATCTTVGEFPVSVQTQLDGVLNVKAWLDGYYDANTDLMPPALYNSGIVASPITVTDSISVGLFTYQHPPSLLAEQQILLHTNGWGQVIFPNISYADTHYVRIQHRNALTTWSQPLVWLTDSMTYDFSTHASQAFGGNEVELEPGVWGFYTGDVNQDLAIDAFDYILLDVDLIVGSYGYLPTDLNGDGLVDSFDYLILDARITGGVSAMEPQ